MNKDQVIKRLCALSSNVGSRKFKSSIPHDCFCEDGKNSCFSFQFDEQIIEFIEQAVNEKLNRG